MGHPQNSKGDLYIGVEQTEISMTAQQTLGATILHNHPFTAQSTGSNQNTENGYDTDRQPQNPKRFCDKETPTHQINPSSPEQKPGNKGIWKNT